MLRLARVVRVYPESHTADVVVIDNNAPLLRVPILGSAGGDVGAFDTPQPETSGNPHLTGGREMVAVLSPLAIEGFVILGFLSPPRRQGHFSDGRMVYRHQSDTYFTVDADGNAELYHPSGSYVRLGTPGHEDLSGKDVDGSWAIKRNTSAAPTLTIGLSAGGTSKSTVTISPNGAVSIAGEGAVSVTAKGGMTLMAQGALSLSGQSVSIASGSGTTNFVGDVVADTVSLKHHVNTLVQPGTGTSGPPQP